MRIKEISESLKPHKIDKVKKKLQSWGLTIYDGESQYGELFRIMNNYNYEDEDEESINWFQSYEDAEEIAQMFADEGFNDPNPPEATVHPKLKKLLDDNGMEYEWLSSSALCVHEKWEPSEEDKAESARREEQSKKWREENRNHYNISDIEF